MSKGDWLFGLSLMAGACVAGGLINQCFNLDSPSSENKELVKTYRPARYSELYANNVSENEYAKEAESIIDSLNRAGEIKKAYIEGIQHVEDSVRQLELAKAYQDGVKHALDSIKQLELTNAYEFGTQMVRDSIKNVKLSVK